MEIIKINDINKYLKKNVKYPTEILIMKNNIEEWLQTYFAPSMKIKLNMKLNLLVDGDHYGIVFDEMALLESIRNLLGIEWKSTSVTEDQKKECILGSIPAKIAELKKVERIEELIYKFPKLHKIFLLKEATIKQSVLIEQDYCRIKPTKVAEELKNKKLRELGINFSIHHENYVQSFSFDFNSFVSTYAMELDQLHSWLNFIIQCISNWVMTKPFLTSLDEKKIMNLIFTEKLEQKPKELAKRIDKSEK